MSEYLNNLNRRYATKQFDSNYKVSPELENLLDQTLDLTPSSYGLQPYKFIKVTNPELRQITSMTYDPAGISRIFMGSSCPRDCLQLLYLSRFQLRGTRMQLSLAATI